MPRLAAAFAKANSKLIKAWFHRLDTFPLDPRLAVAAIGCIPMFVSSTAGPTRTRAFQLATQMGERSACAPAIAAAKRATSGAWNKVELRDRFAKLATKLPEGKPLSPDEVQQIRAIGKTVAKLAKGPPPSEDALAATSTATDDRAATLLQAVYADPANDGPRLVYADHLQEQGDPWGELVALQLQASPTREQQRRIATLLKDKRLHARLLGSLLAIVSEPVFQRGFLYACKMKLVTEAHRALLAHPALATIVELECDDASILKSRALRLLTRLAGATLESLAALIDEKSLPVKLTSLRDLVITEYFGRDADRLGESNISAWKRFGTIGPFKQVRHLGVRANHDLYSGRDPLALAPVLDAPLAQQLESLSVDTVTELAVFAWLDVFRTHPKLTRLRLRAFDANVIEIVRGGKRLEITLEVYNAELGYGYGEMFREFPIAEMPALKVRYLGKAKTTLGESRRATHEDLAWAFATIADADADANPDADA